MMEDPVRLPSGNTPSPINDGTSTWIIAKDSKNEWNEWNGWMGWMGWMGVWVVMRIGVVMDRAVITRHLLNDGSDPFNRQPLTVEQLKSDPELKARIDLWKSQQRKTKSSSLSVSSLASSSSSLTSISSLSSSSSLSPDSSSTSSSSSSSWWSSSS